MMRQILALAGAAVQENPSIAAGSCIFLVAFSLVSANALVGQPGGHPGPLWATRDSVATRAAPRRSAPAPARDVTSPLSLDRIPIPMMRPGEDAAIRDASSLVADAQSGLAALHLYSGEVDGLYGPRTRDAVLRFQRDHGMTETGIVSIVLLDRIEALTGNQNDLAAVEPSLQPRGVAVSAAPAGSKGTEADIRETALVARTQIGLNNFGEVGIVINGIRDEPTREAIRRFQERYGLPVDGMPSPSVIAKLEEIGALKKR